MSFFGSAEYRKKDAVLASRLANAIQAEDKAFRLYQDVQSQGPVTRERAWQKFKKAKEAKHKAQSAYEKFLNYKPIGWE